MSEKKALSFVTAKDGGIVCASSAGSLPCNQQQVKDMRWKDETRDQDPLYSLMLMCKESEGKRNQDAYVRLVNAGPYPMMVLTFNWMLENPVRFCTDPNQFSIVGNDPIFSLGAFEVTVTTYCHLMLRRNDDQGFIQDFFLGGERLCAGKLISCGHRPQPPRGVWRHAPPEKF